MMLTSLPSGGPAGHAAYGSDLDFDTATANASGRESVADSQALCDESGHVPLTAGVAQPAMERKSHPRLIADGLACRQE